MPTLRLVGTLLILAALAGLPTSAWAEFRIGVWQPGGHDRTDVLFTAATADDLDALGVDLLINTPNEVGETNGRYQDFEESIMSQWSNRESEPNGPRGFVVQHAPEDHSSFPVSSHSRRGYAWKLERYAGSLRPNCSTGEIAGNLTNTNLTTGQRRNLGETVRLLSTKWTAYDEFYGYRIGHEADPCGGDGGVYSSDTYANMSAVIDSIRAYDTEHRIIAVGNTLDTRWTGHEQTAFLQNFFRPNTIPGGPDPSPANIFMQEVYILADGDVSEDDVQDRFDYLRNGLDSIGTMVDLALSDNRKAEWHFIVQVTRTNRDMTSTRPPQSGLYRHPTLPELKAQVNMALSRGAKGVTYFAYTSSNGYVGGSGGDQYIGLVQFDRRMTPLIWDRVRTVNDTLRTLGDALYPLTWDAGFPSNRLSNATLVDMVRHATAGRLEFGVFHDDEADYVLVVNRHNLTTGGSQTIDLRFDTQQMQSDDAGNGYYIVEEIVTGTSYTVLADGNSHIWITQQDLAPGDAQLYRIERMEVPTAPQNLTAVEAGDGTVTLRWEIPDNATIDNWQYRQNGGDWQGMSGANAYVYDHLTNTYEYTVMGLTNGTTHTFEVRAHNAAGWGLASASVTATPRLFTLTAVARDEYVFLNWTPAPTRGTPINHYTRRHSSDGGTTWTNPSAMWIRPWQADDPLSYAVQRLTNGVLYTFEVYAYDSAGEVAVASATVMPGEATADVQVFYGSDLYQAEEGGTPVEVTVRLTDWARHAVSIPVTVTRDAGTEAGDYAVAGLTANSLSFAEGAWYQSFEITANEDPDSDDETVTVGLTLDDDDLPSWLGAGTPVTATVRLRDDDRNRMVSFGSASYQAMEGGEAVEVSVELSESPLQTLNIPVRVSADMGTEAGDYTVRNLTADGTVSLSFTPQGSLSQSFEITANEDPDSDDETVSLTFGTLPAGVVAAGTTRQAIVTLRDATDDGVDPDGVVLLSSYSPQESTQLTATLTDDSGGISSTTWQWQRRSSPTAEWTSAAGTSSQPYPWISTYIPQSGDVGDQLRATVSYTDADGPDQSAESSATEAVQAAATHTVSFGSVSYQATEGGSVEVSVGLSPAPSQTLSIPVQVSADAGTEAGDYTVPNLTADGMVSLSFASGVSSQSFTITANQDADSDNETLTLTFGTLPVGVVAAGTTQQATVTLQDDSGDQRGPYYRLAASQPTTPAANTNGDVPSGWRTSRPSATSTQGVWRTIATRSSGSSIYSYSVPTLIESPPDPGDQRGPYYRLAASQPTTPAANTNGDVPSGWRTSRPSATSTQGVWRTIATRSSGSSIYSYSVPREIEPPPDPGDQRGPYYRLAASQPTTPAANTNGGVPSGWRTSRPSATSTQGVWRTIATRSSGSSIYSYSVPREIEPPDPGDQRGPYYRLAASQPTTPAANTNGGVPSGWRTSRPSATSTQGVWRTIATRSSGSSIYSYSVPREIEPPPDPGDQRGPYYRLAASQPTTPAANTNGDVPSGWRTSRPSATSTQGVWRTIATRSSGSSIYSYSVPREIEPPDPGDQRGPYYRLAASQPTTPAANTNGGVPSGWRTSRPSATSTQGVWRTIATRSSGSSIYSYSVPREIEPPPDPGDQRGPYYRLAASQPTTPAANTNGGVPSGWRTSRPSATSTQGVWRTIATRSSGSSIYSYSVPREIEPPTGINFSPSQETRHIDVGDILGYTFPQPDDAQGMVTYQYSLPSWCTRMGHSFTGVAPDRGVSQYLDTASVTATDSTGDSTTFTLRIFVNED